MVVQSMRNHLIRVMQSIAYACALVSSSAFAYLNSPYLSPPFPQASDEVSINIGVGDCDTIVAEPGYPRVTREGNAIRVLLLAVRYDDVELCFLPRGMAVVPFGMFDAGEYQVTVDIFYYDSHGDPRTETLGALPMRVGAGTAMAIPAPATTPASLIALFVALILLGRRRLPKNVGGIIV